MSPMKRYHMVCERRLTSTDICIHPKGRAGDAVETSELDVTTGTSSESFQYRVRKTCRNKEKRLVETQSSAAVLGSSHTDAFVNTVEYAGGLFNYTSGEVDEESESESSIEVAGVLSPGDVAINQMGMILSARVDSTILNVLEACRNCCVGLCNGDVEFDKHAKRKPFSKCKRHGETQNWMKTGVSRKRNGQPVKKKEEAKILDESTSMDGDNMKAFETKKPELEKTLEEEKKALVEERHRLDEEKRRILEERMELMVKKKRLLEEGIISSAEEVETNIYEIQQRLMDNYGSKGIATGEKNSTEERKSGIRGGSFEERVTPPDEKGLREMECKPASTGSYNLDRRPAVAGDSMEMEKQTSLDRVSKEMGSTSGTQRSSFENRSAEIRGSPEMRSSFQRRSIDSGSRLEKVDSNGSDKRTREMESSLQKVGSIGSREPAEIRSVPQILSGSRLERRSAEMGSFPQAAARTSFERKSTDTAPTSQTTGGLEGRSLEYYSLPDMSGSTSGRRSIEKGSVPHVVSSGGLEQKSTGVGSKPELVSSGVSERRSIEMGRCPHMATINGLQRKSTEGGSTPEMIGSFSSERRSPDLAVIPERDNSISSRGSVEMENIPRVERSGVSEKRSGEMGSIADRYSGSSIRKRSTETGSIPQIDRSSERRYGDVGSVPERFSGSSIGKRSTEMGSIPQMDRSSERRLGDVESVPEMFSGSSIRKRSTEMGSIPQIERSSDRISGDVGSVSERFSGGSIGKRSTKIGSTTQVIKSNASEIRSGGSKSIPQTVSSNGIETRAGNVVTNPQEIRSSYSDRRSTGLESTSQVENIKSSDGKSIEMEGITHAASCPESGRKSTEIYDIKEKEKIYSSEIKSPDVGRMRELIAKYALVRRSAGTHSSPEMLNFSSVIHDMTPEEFKKLQDEDMLRLKLKTLELQVLRPGEYKDYREQELLKLQKAIEQRRLEWQAKEDKRRAEEEELRSLERDIKEQLRVISDGEMAGYIHRKMEEEDMELKVRYLKEQESWKDVRDRVCSCLRWKSAGEEKEDSNKKEYEQKIAAPRPSKSSCRSQELDREIGEKNSCKMKKEDTKTASERSSVRSSKENLAGKSGEFLSSVKSREESKSPHGSETSKLVKSSSRSCKLAEDAAPECGGSDSFLKSSSVGSTKSDQLSKGSSIGKDEKRSSESPGSQASAKSSEILRKQIHSGAEIVASAMRETSEEKIQRRASETRTSSFTRERVSSTTSAEVKDRIKAICCESDESARYNIDIENVIARERSFTKYKIKEKSSESPKKSLDSGISASRSRSDDIERSDKGEVDGGQPSDTLGKSLEQSSSASKSLPRQDNKSDTSGVEAQKSSDTLRKSFDSSIPKSQSNISRGSGSETKKLDAQHGKVSMVDVAIGTDPEDLVVDEIKEEAVSLVNTGVGSQLELGVVSIGVGTYSSESFAVVDGMSRKVSVADIGVETEKKSDDKIEQKYATSPRDLGEDLKTPRIDMGMMTESDALSDGAKEETEITKTDIGVGTHSRIFSVDKEIETDNTEDTQKPRKEIVTPESKENLPKECPFPPKETGAEQPIADEEKKKVFPCKSIPTSASQNRVMTPKVAFTQVDTEETIFTKNMSVGIMTSRIDVTRTAVRVNNHSVGCGRSTGDFGETRVNFSSVSVACGSSATDADCFLDTTEEDNLDRNKRRKLRFVAITEDELSSKEFKTMKIRALRHCDRTEEPDRSSKRYRISERKLDSAAGADLTHYLQMKRALDGTMEIPHTHTTKNLRFHIHNSKGDIVGYGELDNQSTSAHGGHSRPGRVMMMKGSEFKRYREHRPVSSRRETCSRSLASGTHSHTPNTEIHRMKPKEKVGTVWAVARIDEFDQGERTMEIVSTDVKKPALKTNGGGKYDNEVYVLVPPNKRAQRK